MRVITGSARGHPLKVPDSAKTRPTPARAKEAIFSSLGARVLEARVLDLFAGSGAFGIEALSRGASSALFVENNRQAAAVIRSNLKSTRLEDGAELLELDARMAIEVLAGNGNRFDLIFADPPYFKSAGGDREQTDWKKFLLASGELKAALETDGLLLIEYDKRDAGLDSPHFQPQKDFRFGDTVITLFRHA